MTRSEHPSGGPGTTLSFLVLLLLAAAVNLNAQTAGGFRAVLDGGVAPVENAPCQLVITALDGDGEPLPSFDWRRRDLSFAGLSTTAGDLFDRVPGEDNTTGSCGGTGYRIEGGILHLSDVVLTHKVVVRQGEQSFEVLERTIFPWAAILPPLVAIILAILTRQVLIALFAGVWMGLWAVTSGPIDGFFLAVTEVIPAALTEERVKIVIFSCLLGSVVALVARMGGTQALVNLMTRFGRSARGAQITTWLAGIFIFFDDYANALLVGNTMRPVTDRFRVSREKLSFLVDATSAPVACIFVISTWIAAEIAYIEGKLATASVQAATGLEPSAAYQVFLSTIPYNFYPFLCLFFGLMVCVLGRDFGPMLKAERRARLHGKVQRDGARPLSSREMEELEPVDENRLRWYNAVLPIGCVVLTVIIALYTSGRSSIADDAVAQSASIHSLVQSGAESDLVARARMKLEELENPPLRAIFGAADSYNALLLASSLGVLVAGLMALGQRLLNLNEILDVATAGIKAMIPAALVLVLAWSLQTVCERLNTSQFLIHHVSFTLSFLPAAVFLLASVVGFSTGTSWGTMGILVPLTIDYACGMAVDAGMTPPEVQMLLASSVGGVLAGAVFGDHCSPISDTTIMSSMASGADHVDHVRTQLPYAMSVALLALIVGYVPAGFGVSPLILLPLGFFAVVVLLFVVGRKTEDL